MKRSTHRQQQESQYYPIGLQEAEVILLKLESQEYVMGANITGGAAWGSWDHRMRGYLPGVGVKEMQLLPEMLSQHERRYNLKFPLSLVFHLCFPLADPT